MSLSKFERLKELFLLKFRFALTSSVATLVDIGLFNIFSYLVFSHLENRATISHVLSFSIAVIVNFYLQRKFIFEMKRTFNKTFLLALLVSLVGLILSTLLIKYLDTFPFFHLYQFITKLVVTGIFFFYNFYFKRYVFERKFI
jgi:putative flippase GtrA